MNCCVVGQRRERGALVVVTIHFVSVGLVSRAGQRQFAGRREARPGRAEVGVGVLGRGLLRRARCQQRDLVHDVLHLVRELLGLRRRRRRRRGVPHVRLGVGVAAELQGGAEALAGARAALDGRLDHADDAARGLASRVARARLVGLEGRRGWERYFAVLADVAEVKVKIAGAGGGLRGGRGQAQGGRARVGRDVPDLLEGGRRQLEHAGAVTGLHDETLRLRLHRGGVATCNNEKPVTNCYEGIGLKVTRLHCTIILHQCM